jgi:peptidoglycan hydrolase CwlO-like protein
MTRLRSRFVVLVCLVLAVLSATPSVPAGAAASDAKTRELEARRREIEKKKAAAAGEIDVLRSSDEKLERALSALNTNVRNQEAAVASARQAAEVAIAQATKLRQDQERTAERLGELRGQLREVAVDAYVHGPSNDISIALASKDLAEATQRQQMLKVVSARQTDVAEELRAAEEDLGVQRVAAEAATERATAKKKAAESKLGTLQTSLASQQRVAADIEDRLEARLGEADALAELDAAVAGQIKARQAQLARLVAARPPAQRASRGATRIVGASGGLATVRGITVAASVAPGLAALLDAADADGLSFSGGGYRDPQSQIAVRRANCGTSDYAIYDMPPSQCSPQTARPGTSMHEQGLAIDFSLNGSLITSRSNPGFRWLAANAGRFGLQNLPEEPWHWSTNGR